MSFLLRYFLSCLLCWLFSCACSDEIYAYVCNLDSSVHIQKVCKEEALISPKLMPNNESLFLRYPNYNLYDESKYFRESLFNRYCDRRYRTKGADESPDEKIAIRKEIFLEWAGLTKELNLTFWMSHDTLLGWYWQRYTLPWDHDPSVQVLYSDLLKNYAPLDGYLHKDRYLFDLNPNYGIRVHQKYNTIDARFIDTFNGYFLNVEAVSFDGVGFHTKAHHAYSTQSLFPLRRSSFEGLQVWIPSDSVKVLSDEYTSSLTDMVHVVDSWVHLPLKKHLGTRQITGRGVTYSFNYSSHSWSPNVEKVNLNWLKP